MVQWDSYCLYFEDHLESCFSLIKQIIKQMILVKKARIAILNFFIDYN